MASSYEPYIKEIVKTISNDEHNLQKDVAEVCGKVLLPLLEVWREKVTARRSEKLKSIGKKFTDIYLSLKLHLVHHLGPDDGLEATKESKLQEFAEKLDGLLQQLTDEDPTCTPSEELKLNNFPGRKHAIDPGSKLLEIFSDLAEHIPPEHPSGSEDHANIVMKMAKYWLKLLEKKNRFRPKVLAKVSHDRQCFIGSSIAVNHFLRPLCLYNRIARFKWSLQKAIIFFEPLATVDSRNWKSSAFCADYETAKAPCQNCAKIFNNLSGFIIGNLGGPKTFLANCAEFCPVNQLILDNVGASSEEEKKMKDALKNYWDQCSTLFNDFGKISSECADAFELKDSKRFEEVYMRVKHKVHIFGRKPECNGELSKRHSHYYLRN